MWTNPADGGTLDLSTTDLVLETHWDALRRNLFELGGADGQSGTLAAGEGVRAFHSANQSIAAGADVVVALNSERFDTHGFHDTATNNSRLTVPAGKAGIYLIQANVEWAASTTGGRTLRIRRNGSQTIADVYDGAADGSGAKRQHVGCLYQLAAGDYVEMIVHHSHSGALNVVASSQYSPELSMVRIGQ
jgi:hypothetical protein